jgi:hypothetical protein
MGIRTWVDYASEEKASAESDEDSAPKPINSFVATSKLKQRWETDFTGPLDSVGRMTIEIGILYALDASAISFDGAWWREKLDPSTYSAPRGVIFQSRLPQWATEAVPWSEAPDTEDG